MDSALFLLLDLYLVRVLRLHFYHVYLFEAVFLICEYSVTPYPKP